MVHSERPDLVLLDLSMPEMDGIDVCRRTKADPWTADTIVVILTATEDSDTRIACAAAGASAYFTKPFRPLQLIEQIDRLLITPSK